MVVEGLAEAIKVCSCHSHTHFIITEVDVHNNTRVHFATLLFCPKFYILAKSTEPSITRKKDHGIDIVLAISY